MSWLMVVMIRQHLFSTNAGTALVSLVGGKGADTIVSTAQNGVVAEGGAGQDSIILETTTALTIAGGAGSGSSPSKMVQ